MSYLRWIYLATVAIVILFFSGLYIYSNDPLCWLPVVVVLSSNGFILAKTHVEPEFVPSYDLNAMYPSIILHNKEEEVNLFTDIFEEL